MQVPIFSRQGVALPFMPFSYPTDSTEESVSSQCCSLSMTTCLIRSEYKQVVIRKGRVDVVRRVQDVG